MKTHTHPAKRMSLAAILLGLAPALVAETNDLRVKRDDSTQRHQQTMPSHDTMMGESQAPSSRQADGLRQSARDPRGSHAGDLIGMDVLGSDQIKLGTINDFIVDARSGKVAHAVVASGGVLGVGSSLRVVPISALKPAGRGMAIDIAAQRWEQAPVFTKDQLPSLAEDRRGREVHEYFGQRPETSSPGRQFALVTDLRGKDIRNGEQTVGEIEDVIISLQSRSAGALIDPNDDFAGNDRKFVVPLNRLGDLQQRNVRTSLTREDFARVSQPSEGASGDWDMSSIFVWPWRDAPEGAAQGANRVSDATRRGADRAADSTERAASRVGDMADTRQKGPPPVAEIQRAVRADAQSLGVRSESIQVVARENKIILQGTVPNESAKDRIEERAERAAPGWNIDNELKVSASDDL